MKQKPKIAVIGLKGLPAFGGAASVGEALINELKNKYDFYVYSISTHTDKIGIYDGLIQIVFKESKVSGIATLKYYLKSLFHCLFLAKYDIIHLHHSESGFITPILRLKYKVIVTFHGVYGNKIDPKFHKYANILFRFSEKMNIQFANKVISVSKVDMEYCKKKYACEIEYIPNGVSQKEIKITDKKYDFLFIAARIYEIKGLHLLLKAIKEYNIAGKLLVIGDLDQNSEYKKQILELAEGLDIEFNPLIKEKDILFGYIVKAKIFVFPSLFEAMSMTLLEVVSLKVPVIASDIEANKNIFSENEITYFKSNEFHDLAEKLCYCILRIQEVQNKAEIAYKTVLNNYTWNNIASKYSQIYEDFLL